jgi:hypothetical protein
LREYWRSRISNHVDSFVLERESAVLAQARLELLATLWSGAAEATRPAILPTKVGPRRVFFALFWVVGVSHGAKYKSNF